jgi:hypothetical protein
VDKKPVPDMAEDVDKNLRLLYFNAFLKPTFLIHATHFGMISMARIGVKGNVEYFGRENEREVAADTMAKSAPPAPHDGDRLNTFFALGEDTLLERLGKAYGEAWPVAEKVA